MRIAMLRLNLAAEDGDTRMFFLHAQALRKLGHDVHIYAAQFDSKFFPNLWRGLDIKVVPPATRLVPLSGNRVDVFRKIIDRLMKNRIYTNAARRIGKVLPPSFDVIIAQNDETYKISADYKARHPKAKFVWIMNNAPFYHSPKVGFMMNLLSITNSFFEELKARYYAREIDLIVVNDKEHEVLAKKLGLLVALMRIPVDFDYFFNSVKGIPAGKRSIMLLGVGSLSPARKFEDIIMAVAELKKDGYDAQAALVCRDFWQSTSYKQFLLDLAARLNIKDRVDFHFEGATDEELRTLQRKSDVFVFPNHIPIWGMSAFEAMAAGLPIVVSSATSVVEVLRDGENALFSEPGDAVDIAAKVKRLMNNPGLYLKIGEAGQRLVKKNLNWENYAREFITKIHS